MKLPSASSAGLLKYLSLSLLRRFLVLRDRAARNLGWEGAGPGSSQIWCRRLAQRRARGHVPSIVTFSVFFSLCRLSLSSKFSFLCPSLHHPSSAFTPSPFSNFHPLHFHNIAFLILKHSFLRQSQTFVPAPFPKLCSLSVPPIPPGPPVFLARHGIPRPPL